MNVILTIETNCLNIFSVHNADCVHNNVFKHRKKNTIHKCVTMMTEKEKKMNKDYRQQMVKAMEFLITHVNDEELLDSWLMCGVADGDIQFGDLELSDDFDEYYIEDKNFKNLMSIFLKTMGLAWKDGGLYCDGIVSCDKTDYHLD